MAEIRPFQGVHYNQELIKDLATVICPPYDIISPQTQQELYRRSQYNFIRIEHCRELPQDTAKDNKYTRAAATLDQWLKQGILKIDKTPSIYLHSTYFTHQGKQYKRCGITARVRLEEWDKKIIHPHEGTLTEPRGDRLNLLWACQTNTSPIFAMFEDREHQVTSLLTEQEHNKPIINISNADGQSHYVWAITEDKVVNQIRHSLANQSLYIADGHHRYESALTYRRERQACSSSTSANEAFNFVMMTLVEISDPGLIVLPPHRLIRGISKPTLSELNAELRALFEIEELPLNKPDVWEQVDSLLASRKPGGVNQIKLVLFGLATERLSVLSLRDFTAASQLIPYFHTELYKRLDVSIIDHIILEKMLGLDSDSQETSLTFSYDRLNAINRVLDQEYQLAFLLSPPRVETIKAIADAGDRMPRKSTYFYPKLPSGLILNRLV